VYGIVNRPALLVAALALALALTPAKPVATASRSDATAASIRKALSYLSAHQLQEPLLVFEGLKPVRDYAGDWPQFFSLRENPAWRVRDVSPFMVAFIHHSLTPIVEEHRRELGLKAIDVRAARSMRRRAIQFISRFESRPGAADAGTFGFWPFDAYPRVPGPLLELLMLLTLRGPILGGDRVPLNLPIFPNALAIPPDADVTATSYAALLDDALLDGGAGADVPSHQFFVDWRDIGLVPRRSNPPWLPPASGAFLTWLSYRRDFLRYANDVDLVVNANVLFSLGRQGRLDVPGVDEAIELINEAAALGLHRDRLEEITLYYPDNLVFHYAVSRAFHEGGVANLAPAVEILADELEASAILRKDGAVYWDRGAPHLNTAFAMLTLMNAGRSGDLVPRAAAYLSSEQAADGGFEEAPFFIARTDGGQVFQFHSASFVTGMVLEALARYALGR
jgi:hypothetical protein